MNREWVGPFLVWLAPFATRALLGMVQGGCVVLVLRQTDAPHWAVFAFGLSVTTIIATKQP